MERQQRYLCQSIILLGVMFVITLSTMQLEFSDTVDTSKLLIICEATWNLLSGVKIYMSLYKFPNEKPFLSASFITNEFDSEDSSSNVSAIKRNPSWCKIGECFAYVAKENQKVGLLYEPSTPSKKHEGIYTCCQRFRKGIH